MVGRVFLIVLAATSIVGCSGEPEPTPMDNALAAAQREQMEALERGIAIESKGDRTDRLREKAKTDPEGADAEAIDNMGQNEVIATAINSAGYLCARVVTAYPVGGNINVECVEYRNGKGRVKYRVDPNAGTVEPR
jgi:hypothetical protein